MTERYLVMPRGINVGTRNRVPMAELRSKLTGGRYWDVATVLQSGNVIVSTAEDRPDEVVGIAMGRLLRDEFDVDGLLLKQLGEKVDPARELTAVVGPGQAVLERSRRHPWRAEEKGMHGPRHCDRCSRRRVRRWPWW